MNWLFNILHKIDKQYNGNADSTVRNILNSVESEIEFALTNRAF